MSSRTFTDTMVECQSCGRRFVFTVTEQRAMAERGEPIIIPNECPACRRRPAYGRRQPETGKREGRLKGRVKWYSSQKGYGFIVLEDGSELFVHRSALSPGLLNLDEGQAVEFAIKQTEKGPEADQVKLLTS